MKYTSMGLLGLAALAAASDVHDLTQDTFDDFVKENNLVLAEFFAPWCGHCKALEPEFATAATDLLEKPVKLAKIDCVAEADLCQKHNVAGYPTLKVFRGLDNVSPYAGARKAEAIVSYMTKQTLPAVSLLPSADALEEFKTADKVVLVGFFAADDKSSNATYAELADALRDDYLFAATSDAALAKAEGVSQPAVVLYKSFDEGKTVYSEAFSQDALVTFAKTAATPLIGEVGPETYAGYMDSGLPLAYIFSSTAEERESLAKDLKPIAEKYKGKINFATIDAEAFGQHGSNLNLEVGKWPAFAIQDTAKNQKFPYAEAGDVSKLTEKLLGKFVDDFHAGEIEPSIKSEPIPEKQDGPVTVVVAHNYKDIVLDTKKDVLIEFYAPWCGHCKNLEPKYAELGGLFKDFADKVTIAKVDATNNDVPDEIQGFPTIKLYTADGKDAPIDYNGGRTVEELAAFIRDNGSHKVDVTHLIKTEEPEEVDTEDMPHQAAAATEAAGEAAEGVAEKVKEAVKNAGEAVKQVVLDDDEVDTHDEL